MQKIDSHRRGDQRSGNARKRARADQTDFSLLAGKTSERKAKSKESNVRPSEASNDGMLQAQLSQNY